MERELCAISASFLLRTCSCSDIVGGMKTIRHMLPLCVVSIILLLAATPLWAAGGDTPRFQKALGFQGGQLSGLGLSYQEWKGDKGYQVAAGAMYYPNGEYSYRILDYTIGLELQSSLYHDSFSNWLAGRLYLFAGLNHQGYINMVDIDPNPDDSVYEYAPGAFQVVIGLGGGIGVEATLFDHFSIALEIGYGVFWTPTKPTLLEQVTVNIVPQVGLRYRY